MSLELVRIADIYAARRRLPAEVVITPLLQSESLSKETGARVWLKADSLQVTGSYKARGAFTILDRLPAEARKQGAALSSSGNFAQAFAYMGRLLSIPTVTVMGENVSPLKIRRTEGFGAEVVLCGSDFEARWRTLQQLEAERGVRAVNHFEDMDVIAGHGTLGLELLEQCPEPDAVLIPVSSGGLIAGVAAAIKSLRPATRVIGVQPEGSSAMHASRAAGRATSIPAVTTICDALTAQRPGELPFAHVQAFVDDLVLVSDPEAIAAVAYLAEQAKLVVEPGGAVAVAALLCGRVRPSGTVIAHVSGGNIDLERLAAYVQEGSDAVSAVRDGG
jgi:threonine dehydratase